MTNLAVNTSFYTLDGFLAIMMTVGGILGCLEIYLRFYGRIKTYVAKRNKKSNQGIVWVWTVAALTLFIFSIIWATVGFVSHYYLETITALFPDAYVGNAAKGLATIDLSIYLLPLIIIGGVLLWAIVNSMRREEVQQPYAPY